MEYLVGEQQHDGGDEPRGDQRREREPADRADVLVGRRRGSVFYRPPKYRSHAARQDQGVAYEPEQDQPDLDALLPLCLYGVGLGEYYCRV